MSIAITLCSFQEIAISVLEAGKYLNRTSLDPINFRHHLETLLCYQRVTYHKPVINLSYFNNRLDFISYFILVIDFWSALW